MKSRANGRLKRRFRLAVTFGLVVIPFHGLTTALPAAAGDCSWAGCGEVVNKSSHMLNIARLGVGGGRCTIDDGTVHPCEVKQLPPGQGAGGGRGFFDDVDAVQDPFWGLKYRIWMHGGYSGEFVVPPGRYLKILDTQTVDCYNTNGGWGPPICYVF